MPSKIGRPPTKGSFKSGDDPRRNRNGQINKPALQFRRAIRDLIVSEGSQPKTVTNPGTGEKVTLTKIEWVVLAAYSAAMAGDAKARDFIVERVEGKVSQPVTLDQMTEEQRKEYVRGLLAAGGFVLAEPKGEGLQS